MTNKIKICFILSHLPQGGAERQTILLIENLDFSKYDVTLFLYSCNEVFYSEIFDLPITVKIIQSTAGNKYLAILKNIYNIKKFLIRNDFDIVHTLLYHNGFYVRIAAPSKYKNRIIYSIRNSLADFPKKFLILEKYLIKKSIVVTNSNKAKDELIDLISSKYINKVFLIRNGFNINRFSSKTERSFSNKEIIIGNVGRQTTQKNQIQILRAINKIKNQFPIKFYLIGDSSLDKTTEIKDYIKEHNLIDNVILMNSQKDIENFYHKFNIFVLSSLYEGTPNVLFEAMLSKCLCIVSKNANSDNFIIDRVNGLTYDGSDEMLISKITEAVNILKNNSEKEIINNAYEYVVNNFGLNSMVKSYEELYNGIIK